MRFRTSTRLRARRAAPRRGARCRGRCRSACPRASSSSTVRGGAVPRRIVQEQHARAAAGGLQGGGGQPAPASELADRRAARARATAGPARARARLGPAGEAQLGRGLSDPSGPRRKVTPPGEPERRHHVLEGGAQEARLLALHGEVVDQGHEGPDGAVLGARVGGRGAGLGAPARADPPERVRVGFGDRTAAAFGPPALRDGPADALPAPFYAAAKALGERGLLGPSRAASQPSSPAMVRATVSRSAGRAAGPRCPDRAAAARRRPGSRAISSRTAARVRSPSDPVEGPRARKGRHRGPAGRAPGTPQLGARPGRPRVRRRPRAVVYFTPWIVTSPARPSSRLVVVRGAAGWQDRRPAVPRHEPPVDERQAARRPRPRPGKGQDGSSRKARPASSARASGRRVGRADEHAVAPRDQEQEAAPAPRAHREGDSRRPRLRRRGSRPEQRRRRAARGRPGPGARRRRDRRRSGPSRARTSCSGPVSRVAHAGARHPAPPPQEADGLAVVRDQSAPPPPRRGRRRRSSRSLLATWASHQSAPPLSPPCGRPGTRASASAAESIRPRGIRWRRRQAARCGRGRAGRSSRRPTARASRPAGRGRRWAPGRAAGAPARGRCAGGAAARARTRDGWRGRPLQVPQAAVDRLQAVPGGAGAEVVRLDEGHPEARAGRVPGRGRAVDAAADHEQVVLDARREPRRRARGRPDVRRSCAPLVIPRSRARPPPAGAGGSGAPTRRGPARCRGRDRRRAPGSAPRSSAALP